MLWNNSDLELAVHAPVPAGQKEVIGAWGYPDERQSWTWETNDSLSVNVYSHHAKVELFLNGKSLGSQAPDTDFTATFSVPYTPGTLKAVAHDAFGQLVAQRNLTTAGMPAKLVLLPDRASISAHRSDLSYITAEVSVAHDGTC